MQLEKVRTSQRVDVKELQRAFGAKGRCAFRPRATQLFIQGFEND